MNFIILEGFGLWMVLFFVLLLLLITFISLTCVVLYDKRICNLESQLYKENQKYKRLFRKNLELSFKSGELDIDVSVVLMSLPARYKAVCKSCGDVTYPVCSEVDSKVLWDEVINEYKWSEQNDG